jgi:DNA-binding transcriptional regulator YiaG
MKSRQIKSLRKKLGLSQEAFYDRLGMKADSDAVKRQTISRWETGERNPGNAASALLTQLAKSQKEGVSA